MSLAALHSPEAWRERFGGAGQRSIVTIGNFDGVHRGHQKILHRVVELSHSNHALPSVLTFFPHPVRVLRPTAAPSLLSTLDQRLAAFEASGIEAALIVRFDAKLSEMSAEEFARQFLVETMRAESVLVGENFRFGHKQKGDVKLLRDLGSRWNFNVEIVPPVVEDGAVISSSAIREALREGRVNDATKMLGRPYALQGDIRIGTGQGTKLIVPTLNLATEQEMLPKAGVYVTEAVVEGRSYGAATNIGTRPTFDGIGITIESHLLDFSQRVTNGRMEVRFLEPLRDEQKFSSFDALREQVLQDIESARVLYQTK